MLLGRGSAALRGTPLAQNASCRVNVYPIHDRGHRPRFPGRVACRQSVGVPHRVGRGISVQMADAMELVMLSFVTCVFGKFVVHAGV